MGIALSCAPHSVNVIYCGRTVCTHWVGVPSNGEEGDQDGQTCQCDCLEVVPLDRKDGHSYRLHGRNDAQGRVDMRAGLGSI